MNDFPRLIENAFPLKQTSLDSVHEKTARDGHISTLHLWPARRPLAASRAALIATLLPDPGTPETRRDLCEKLAGKIVKRVERKKMPNGQIVERVKEETEGGILRWGREIENADTLNWFKKEIRKAYGGRAPRVLDPFSGGGAIPLEAMRLGCEATAVDINPVAWFILKCTLEYPQKLAGRKHPLPEFILRDKMFMEGFFNAQGLSKAQVRKRMEDLGHKLVHMEQMSLSLAGTNVNVDADLAWHVRAWGQWVLSTARKALAPVYPTYADFEPLTKDRVAYEHRPMTLVPLGPDGKADADSLNADLSADYLAVKANPRWIAKPTVAYLWARTVKCKNCRAELPLLKTRWLCKTDRKRVLLTMTPRADKTGVDFGVQVDVPVQGGNAAQKREHDKRIAGGTMSRAGAKCPCCSTIMTMEDIRIEGKASRLGSRMTAVAVDAPEGKAYRLPTLIELEVASPNDSDICDAFKDVPFGVPEEPTPSAEALGMRVPLYGFDRWRKLFTPRQLKALGTIITATREARTEMLSGGYGNDWIIGITAYLACGLDRTLDFANCGVQWKIDVPTINHSFVRFALPITWDYAEGNLLSPGAGGYIRCLDRIATALDSFVAWKIDAPAPHVVNQSSTKSTDAKYDLVLTDPPYYDAIPYSDLMDFFYIWLRRVVSQTDPDLDASFREPLSPKWDHATNDGELIDDCSRHGNDASKSKQVYEDGMAQVFQRCSESLTPEGRLVIVFANKAPAAWETLVSAIIRAGFTVDGTWPIQTEQSSRMRAQSSAALASSVWLVCKKRSPAARVGWDTGVLDEMRANIAIKLQTYWDAGIRGPDFIWAATGPALEAYSKHPAVKKADQPGQLMGVAEFLNHVRRLVVDYVVGKVLTGEQDGSAQASASDRLDEPTAYYLLHRHDFGLDDAPVGTCILYAVSCGLSDSELVQTWDILAKTGADDTDNDEDVATGDEDAEEAPESTGGKVRLKTWSQRKNKSMGYEAPDGRSVPLVDRVHRLMHLWKAGDVQKVDEYLDEHGMRRHELFKRLVQSLIELSEAGSDERSLMESLSNHIGAKGTKADAGQMVAFEEKD